MENHHIILEEQGLRDGIQNLDAIIPTDQQLELIDKLIDAGIKRIQVASFVHPRLVPQMADAEEVSRKIKKREGVVYSGLVLNVKGVERAIDVGMNHLACSISASDTHSQKNARKTITEAKSAFKEMIRICQSNNIAARGGIQCAFGCRYEGAIDQEHVMDMVKFHLDTGIEELALADSTGMGNPLAVETLMNKIVEESKGIPVILHLHNTENKGYANVFAAIRSGVRIFDTAFGGLGGCPFIKSATGNIATEDTNHMLQQMGMDTGIDSYKIARIAKEFGETMGFEMPGHMHKMLLDDSIKNI